MAKQTLSSSHVVLGDGGIVQLSETEVQETKYGVGKEEGVVSDRVAAGGDSEGVERRGELCQGIHLLQSSKIGALKRERLKKQTDRCYHNMCNPKPCVKSNSEFYTDGGLITT